MTDQNETIRDREAELTVQVELVASKISELLTGTTLELASNALVRVTAAVISEIPDNDDLKKMVDHTRFAILKAAAFAYQRNEAEAKGVLVDNAEVTIQ